MTTMTAQDAPRTTRTGFPVIKCRTCDGTGYRAVYSNVDGGTCFYCHKGWRYFPSVEKIVYEYRSALAAAQRADGGADMNPGDVVRVWGSKDPAAWRTVATVEKLDIVCGWQVIRGEKIPRTWRHAVTFTDGSTVETWGERWQRRATVDPAPYVARAMAAHRRAAARAARRAVR